MTNATALKRLTMDVVQCDTDFLEHLPHSLRSLKFTLSTDAIPPFGRGESLRPSRTTSISAIRLVQRLQPNVRETHVQLRERRPW